MNRQNIIAIVGPTASGKTALGVFLAENLGAEIVSCDSMQIYKQMDIATAKPTAEEMHGIKHHLIDFLPPDSSYSVASFCRDAAEAVNDISSRGKLPIIVGGTGLYLDSFLNSISFLDGANNTEIRSRLNLTLKEKGVEYLYARLCEVDPEAAEKIHPNNALKIIRALEVFESSGFTITEQIRQSRSSQGRYNVLYIGISYRDREKLYDRINSRVDLMLEKGLLNETKNFYEGKTSETSVAAIGYKELKPYLDGERSLEECVEALKLSTRHYAKRQLTWFRRNENIIWFYADDYSDISELYEAVLSKAKLFTGGEMN